jgi:hypothetical protein
MNEQRTEAAQQSRERLIAAMAQRGLDVAESYFDGYGDTAPFEVIAFGDPDDGRAFVIEANGRVQETDR